jgi:hypothetical protein
MPDRDPAQPMTDPPRRRSGDRVPADVKLYVNDEITDSRHTLRNEFAEAVVGLQRDLAGIRQDIQVGNLAAVTETAQMKATLQELIRGQAVLRTDVDEVQRDVSDLKANDVAADRVADRMRWLVGAVIALAAVVVAATGVLLSSVH